uniref:Putative sodium-dependent multivitamin transporter n=1 Tax=Ixodes ricinus TaxID=34613 RepID=A0A6B0VCT4_IXORI
MSFAVEYAVFTVVMLANLGLGLYFALFKRLRDQSTGELFLGNRTLKTIPLALSVFASTISSVSVVAITGHFYAYGFHFAWGAVAAFLVLPVSFLVIIPVLYRLKVTSIFEYIKMRYGKYTALVACAIYFFLMQSNGAVSIFAASVAVSTIFQVRFLWCSLAIGLTGTFYTALGGLRGVVWTDSMQAVLSILAPVTVIIKILYDSKTKLVQLEPLNNLDPTPYFLDISLDLTKDENVWACLLGMLGYQIYLMGLEQMTVQRYAAARTLEHAKRMAVTSTIMTSLFYILRACTALSLIYWYRNCDPLATGDITTVDQLLPFYVSTRLLEFPGFCGIFLVGVVSAATSTVSSIINSCAAVCYVDMVSPLFTMSDHRAALLTRGIAFGIGIVMTSYSAAIGYMGSATKVIISIYSAVTGPFCGLLLLAFLFPCANSKVSAYQEQFTKTKAVKKRVPAPPH